MGKTLNKFQILKDKHCITDLEKVIFIKLIFLYYIKYSTELI